MNPKYSQFFVLLSLFLCAWGTSGTRVIPLILMFASAGFAFVFALWDNSETPLISKSSSFKNPFFISGTALIALALVQTLNPDLIVYEYCESQCVEFIKHVEWLPSGIIRDPEFKDSASVLIALLATWYFAMACWKLLKNEKFAEISLKFFAINGALMGLLAILQKYTNAQGIYWSIPTNAAFYGSFFLVNAAGNFLIMSACACFALSIDAKAKKRGFKTPALWAALGVFTIFCVLQCTSTGAKALSLLALGLYALILLWIFTRSKILIWTSCGLLVLSALAFVSYKGGDSFDFLESKYKNTQASFEGRLKINKISEELFKSSPVFGVGGGAYGVRAEILVPQSSKYRWQTKTFINSAHNDFFEYACEYGIVGALCVLLCILLWIVQILKNYREITPAKIILIFAVLISILHSLWDLHLHIPATMFAFVFMMSQCQLKNSEGKLE